MAKSVGQWVGTIAGAVIGFFVPGSYVALGAAIGGAIGGAIDPPKGPDIVGPRVDDLKVQTATYGAIKPRAYGTVMVSGNVFWIEGDQIREVSTTEEQQGGKGGGGSEVTTYSYYATFAVGLCKGPITGIRRLWIGDELVYSSVNAADSGAAAQQLAENALSTGESVVNWTLFNGTDTQGPSTRMQADKGIGNVSSYPGEAYLVIEDLNLSKWSNTMVRAQVKAEIVIAGAYAVSDVEMSKFPKYNELAGYGGAPWQQTRLIWAGIFDDTGITIISWMYRDPDGYSVAIEFERQEFTYEKTLTNRTIGRYEMGGGFNQWFNIYVMCQADEEMLVSVQGNISTPNDYTLGFHTAGASVWWPAIVTWAGLPVGGYSVTHLGRYFIGGNGYVFEVNQAGVIGQSAAITTYWMVASENYLFVLTTQNLGLATTTIKKLSKVDLSVVATYSQTTYGQGSIQVIDDDSFYTTGYLAGTGNYLYKWVGGVVVSTTLVGSSSSIASKNFRVVDEDEKMIFYTPQFWQSSSIPAPGIRMSFQSLDDSAAKLRDIITAECGLVGIAPADLSLATLTNSDVRGFKIAAVAAVRSNFDPLQAAFPFDAYQAGYKIKFVSRGGASIGSIPEIDLGANADGRNQVLLPSAREMDSQLPSKVSVVFLNSAREYDSDEQYAERLNVNSVAERRVELAIVLTPTEAAKIADVLLAKDWLERTALGPFALPPTWAHLEPSDVVTISHRGATYEARITRIEYRADGSLECSAVLSSAATYTSTALGASPVITAPLLVGQVGSTNAYFLDIPRILENQDTTGIPFGLMGAAGGWPGGALVSSDDSGNSFQAVASTNTRCNVFTAVDALSASGGYSIDGGQILNVTAFTPSATLASVTFDQLYSMRSNLAAYGAEGRWEIVAFKTVSGSAGSYALTDFIRGLYGTELYSGTHVAGDLLIMLDGAITYANLPSAARGVPRLYRAVTQGQPLDSAPDLTNTYQAIATKPVPVVDLGGWRELVTRDWTIDWQRRTRTPVTLFSGLAVPLFESSELYDVEIWTSGFGALKRTFSGLTSASVLYTGAQQTTDFGSAQITLSVRIYQLSSVVGRGVVFSGTVSRSVNNPDPYIDQVIFASHFNGTDGSTTFIDEKGSTFTATGTPTISTTQSRFGGASGKFLGTSGYIATNSTYNLGTSDFTLDFFVHQASDVAGGYESRILQFGTATDGTDGFEVGKMSAENGLRLRNGYSSLVGAGPFSLGAQTHVVVQRSSGVTKLAVGGIWSTTGLTLSTSAAKSLYIGTMAGSWVQNTTVYIDDLRLTLASRYTMGTTFTPPTTEFPNP